MTNSSTQQTLKLVRSLLSGPGGASAALTFLERRTHENYEIRQSAVVWACLADLREQVGDIKGAREAGERTSLLRLAPVRTLSFDDHSPQLRQLEKLKFRQQQQQQRKKLMSETPLLHSIKPSQQKYTVDASLAQARRLGRQCRDLISHSPMGNITSCGSTSTPGSMNSAIIKTEQSQSKLQRSRDIGKWTKRLLEQQID